MNIVVNGLMVNYQKLGYGKKIIICLPGWGANSTTFSKLIAQLPAEYTAFTLDLPGFGGSQAPSEAWGLADYADFVSAWQKKINLSNIDCLLGHSYGGAIAIAGLGAGRLKAGKLVLLAAAGIRNQNKMRKYLLKSISKTARLPLYALPRAKRQKLRARFYQAAGSDMLLLPHMEQTFKKIINEDVQAEAKRISVPTLLIYGSADKSTPPSYGRILSQAIPTSRLEIIQGAGHFLHQEQPAIVATLVKDFLEMKMPDV